MARVGRRALLTGMAAAMAFAGRGAHAGDSPCLAVTIDDFNISDGALMSGAQKHDAILNSLAAEGIQAAGFISGRYIDSTAGKHHLAAWAEAGHLIGNHTYHHAWYGGETPGDLGADIDALAVLIKGYATWRPLFRFPFLAEGRTVAARDAHRAVLQARGLNNGHVTLDASDWFVNGRLLERLQREPGADLTPYRAFYISHLLDRASFYDRLARDVLGYSPPHTLLLHHNLTTALFLADTLKAFKAAGWRFIDAETAFAHPVYASQPDIAPAANSLIWQLAKEDGRFDDRLRSPGEDGDYEKPAMDALGL